MSEKDSGDWAGLTDAQRRFLSNRHLYDSDAECARALGLNENTPAMWKSSRPRFRKAYQEARHDPVNLAREIIAELSVQAAEKLRKMLDESDPKTAYRYIDQALKATGLGKEEEGRDEYWEAFVAAARAIAGREGPDDRDEEEAGP